VRPDEAHLRLLAAMPELGPEFGMEPVLADFGQWTWMQHLAGHADVVRRAFDYVEWLHEHAPATVAEPALVGMFHDFPWRADVAAWLGPRTRAALRASDWAPTALA
jgi:hypothetical protein